MTYPGCGRTIKRIDALLRETGGGLDSADLKRRLGLSADHISNALTIGVGGGLFEFHTVPHGRAWNRRVYYAAGMKPEKAPPPPPPAPRVAAPRKADDAPNGTRRWVDPRFHVDLPADYTSSLSSAECRPWAMAAAQARSA